MTGIKIMNEYITEFIGSHGGLDIVDCCKIYDNVTVSTMVKKFVDGLADALRLEVKDGGSSPCVTLEHAVKGSQCSVSGSKYEKQIHNITICSCINDIPFNTQKVADLGGSSSNNDINCNYIDKDVGIEIKKFNTPDWMQCSIKFDSNTKIWQGSKKCKIPNECRCMFDELIKTINLFDGNIPPFITKSITHEEWKDIKKTN